MTARTAKLKRNRGDSFALQAQLDEVARVLGAERMKAADGYHYEAVVELYRERNEARAALAELQERHRQTEHVLGLVKEERDALRAELAEIKSNPSYVCCRNCGEVP